MSSVDRSTRSRAVLMVGAAVLALLAGIYIGIYGVGELRYAAENPFFSDGSVGTATTVGGAALVVVALILAYRAFAKMKKIRRSNG